MGFGMILQQAVLKFANKEPYFQNVGLELLIVESYQTPL